LLKKEAVCLYITYIIIKNDRIGNPLCNGFITSKSNRAFGFSDGVTIYLNDKALYAGSDIFMSRDYRFLGTIGFFDTLFLPLKKGDNELWLVVSEVFGGWGVKAKLENMDNISLK
jgi:hypothetical protein